LSEVDDAIDIIVIIPRKKIRKLAIRKPTAEAKSIFPKLAP
jgi:hypothetical protein